MAMPRSILLLTAVFTSLVFAQGGTWVDTTFVPPSLGFERMVTIYLPEGYDPYGTEYYPVVYWLHGWGGGPHSYLACCKMALDSLISSGAIQPVIVVKPDGDVPPFSGSMWANSELYGDFEDFVTIDLIDMVETAYRAIPLPWMRSISGHSMGGIGSMDIALRHTDLYSAVASHAGFLDVDAAMPYFIPQVIRECPEPLPPYTYDWGNGDYTDALFLYAGAYSPNLDNPPYYVDFILDEYAAIIDSVWTLWSPHSPAHKVKSMAQPIDLGIWFDCGTDDGWIGCYESNCGYSDTLTSLGIEHEFVSWPGVAHPMNLSRFMAAFLFLNDQMTGIGGSQGLPASTVLYPASPNPFDASTTLRFDLARSGHTRLDVFDLSGRLVRTMLDSALPAGAHSVEFASDDLAGGIYLFVLQAGVDSRTGRCVLLR
jgi:S-formylglutathione hydrolase FrmB